jgi:hypothetical protein
MPMNILTLRHTSDPSTSRNVSNISRAVAQRATSVMVMTSWEILTRVVTGTATRQQRWFALASIRTNFADGLWIYVPTCIMKRDTTVLFSLDHPIRSRSDISRALLYCVASRAPVKYIISRCVQQEKKSHSITY